MNFDNIKKIILEGFILGLAYSLVMLILVLPGVLTPNVFSSLTPQTEIHAVLIWFTYFIVWGMSVSIMRSIVPHDELVLVFIVILAGAIAGLVCWFIPTPGHNLFVYIGVGIAVSVAAFASMGGFSAFGSSKNKTKSKTIEK